jgi:hypothetical protein
MKHDDKVALVSVHGGSDDELLSRTLKTVAILVSACVLFVGALSLAAVLVTSKAVGSAGAEARAQGPAADPPSTNVKKPTSI